MSLGESYIVFSSPVITVLTGNFINSQFCPVGREQGEGEGFGLLSEEVGLISTVLISPMLHLSWGISTDLFVSISLDMSTGQ